MKTGRKRIIPRYASKVRAGKSAVGCKKWWVYMMSWVELFMMIDDRERPRCIDDMRDLSADWKDKREQVLPRRSCLAPPLLYNNNVGVFVTNLPRAHLCPLLSPTTLTHCPCRSRIHQSPIYPRLLPPSTLAVLALQRLPREPSSIHPRPTPTSSSMPSQLATNTVQMPLQHNTASKRATVAQMATSIC